MVKYPSHSIFVILGSNNDYLIISFCFIQTPWLDGKHVVFGEVLEGYDIVKKVEAVGSQSGKPSKEVRILESGELVLEDGKWVQAPKN